MVSSPGVVSTVMVLLATLPPYPATTVKDPAAVLGILKVQL